VVELAALAAARSVDLVDAPLAGQGVQSVRDHAMWVLAGGEAEVVERLRPVVEPFAARLVHAGGLGAGSALKLAHNVMVYLGYLAVIEAVELGHAAGVADGLVKEVTLASETLSSQSEVFLDIYERRRLDPGGTAENATFATYAALSDKDLGHAVEVAAANGLDLPGARMVATMGDRLYRVEAPAVAGDGAGGDAVVPSGGGSVGPVAIPEAVRPLFDGKPVAFVTTMRPDARMSTNPMAVVLGDDGIIRLSTITSRRKVRNLLADDRISICVVQPDNLNRYVEVRGRAVLEPDPDRTFIDSIAQRYMDVDRYPFDRSDDERVIISLVPEHVSSPTIPLADDPPFRK
jgi:PPOX class probable F420-dependent enzyme